MDELEIKRVLNGISEKIKIQSDSVQQNIADLQAAGLDKEQLLVLAAWFMAKNVRNERQLNWAMPLAIEARLTRTIVLNKELHGISIDSIINGGVSDEELYSVGERDPDFDPNYEPSFKYQIDFETVRAVIELMRLKRSKIGKESVGKRKDRVAEAETKVKIEAKFVEWKGSGKKEHLNTFIYRVAEEFKDTLGEDAIRRFVSSLNEPYRLAKKLKKVASS